MAFSAGAGGRLCAACAAAARAGGRRVGTMPVAVLDAAADLIEPGARTDATMSGLKGSALAGSAPAHRIPRERGPAPPVPPPALAALAACVRDLTARFLEYHLESRPRSYRQFLSVPNRNRPTSPA